MPLLYVVLVLIVVAAVAWLIKARLPIQGDAKVAGGIRTIVNVVLGLLVVGIALWLINSYVPMAGSIKAILNIVVVVATCVVVLQAVGLWGQVVSAWSNLTHRLYH
jgi:predicted membrane protein